MHRVGIAVARAVCIAQSIGGSVVAELANLLSEELSVDDVDRRRNLRGRHAAVAQVFCRARTIDDKTVGASKKQSAKSFAHSRERSLRCGIISLTGVDNARNRARATMP